jgi:hypothetical protein
MNQCDQAGICAIQGLFDCLFSTCSFRSSCSAHCARVNSSRSPTTAGRTASSSGLIVHNLDLPNYPVRSNDIRRLEVDPYKEATTLESRLHLSKGRIESKRSTRGLVMNPIDSWRCQQELKR